MRATESAELEAYRDCFAAAPESFPAEARESGCAVALRFPPAAQVVEINRILGVTAISEVDALAPVYGDAPVVVSLDPEAGLDQELVRGGFRPGYPWHKFERRAGEPIEVSSDLAVDDARRPEDFGLTFARAYGMPDAM